MIIFEKVRYKNLLSVGNNFLEIDINSHKKTLVVGPNGNGKCVHPTTEIEIQFDSVEIEKKFKDFLS